MNFVQAMRLATWVNDHPPAEAAPIPDGNAWAVAVKIMFVNVTTNEKSHDREVARSYQEARALLGY